MGLSLITIIFTWINLVLIGILGYLAIKFLVSGIRFFISNNKSEKQTVRRSLGELLKDYRIKNNMTQEFVAQRLGCHARRYQNGKTVHLIHPPQT